MQPADDRLNESPTDDGINKSSATDRQAEDEGMEESVVQPSDEEATNTQHNTDTVTHPSTTTQDTTNVTAHGSRVSFTDQFDINHDQNNEVDVLSSDETEQKDLTTLSGYLHSTSEVSLDVDLDYQTAVSSVSVPFDDFYETNSGYIFCPICLSTASLPVSTNCNHVFCGDCFILLWTHNTWFLPMKCPYCRQMVGNVRQVFTPEEMTNDTDSRDRVLHAVNLYNHRFSTQPRTMAEHLRSIPFLFLQMFYQYNIADVIARFMLARGVFLFLWQLYEEYNEY